MDKLTILEIKDLLPSIKVELGNSVYSGRVVGRRKEEPRIWLTLPFDGGIELTLASNWQDVQDAYNNNSVLIP